MRVTRRGTARVRRSALAAAAALACLLLQAAPAAAAGPAAAATSTPAPTASTDGGVTLLLATGDEGLVTKGQDLAASVTVMNGGGSALGSGTLRLSRSAHPLSTRHALRDWLSGDEDTPRRTLSEAAGPRVAPGTQSKPVTVSASADDLHLSGGSAVYGLDAELDVGGETAAHAYGALVWNPGASRHRIGLTIAVPITTPPSGKGLIGSDRLADYTGKNGLLTKELNAVAGQKGVAIGVDPRIIASIRALGTSAPDSATEWLTRLEEAKNDTFPLRFGDADVAAQLQSSLGALLEPTSLRYALDAGDFPASPGDERTTAPPESTPTATPTPTPTETGTPEEPNLPGLDDLLRGDYTLSGIAWPGESKLRGKDFTALAKAGLTTTLLDGTASNAAGLGRTPSARLTVPGGTGLVSDTGLSNSLGEAVTATSDRAWNAAMAKLNAQLLLAADDGGSSSRVVLATLKRGQWPSDWFRAWRSYSALSSTRWVESSTLTQALAAPRSPGLRLDQGTEDAKRTAKVSALAVREHEVDDFASALVTPELLTGRIRAEFLSLLAVGWESDPDSWGRAVASNVKETAALLDSVTISPPSGVLVVSSQSSIPISISNTLKYPVKVVLTASPSNGRLEIDGNATKTVQGGARSVALVPVKARLGNGKVDLDLRLFTTTGVPLGGSVSVPASIHADWEGIGALVVGSLVVALFGFGIVRNIVKRVRHRPEEAENPGDDSDDETAGDDGSDAAPRGGGDADG